MKWLITILTIFISTITLAQDYLPSEEITTRDGLSSQSIRWIIKDKDGFMWFAAAEGLNRYDGVEWKIYKHDEDDSTSINGNYIFKISQSEDGNLLLNILHEDKTFSWDYFDRKTEKFRRATNEEIISAKIFTDKWTFQTKDNKKWEWILDDRNKKYVLIDLETEKIESFKYKDFGGFVLPIDKNGEFWFPKLNATDKPILTSFTLPKNIAKSDWKYSQVDNNGNIWLITRNKHVYKYDITIDSITKIGAFEDFNMGRPLYEDEQGTLWLPHRFGVTKIRRKFNYFDVYFKDANIKTGNKGDNVECYTLIQHSADSIFAHFGYGGLAVIDSKSGYSEKRMNYTQISTYYPNMLATDAMIVATPDSLIWMGVRLGRLARFNPATREIKVFEMPDSIIYKPKRNLPGLIPLTLHLDKNQKLWFLLNDGHLYSFDIPTSTFSVIDTTQIFHRGVIYMLDDGMWICNDDFLMKVSLKGKMLEKYALPKLGMAKSSIEVFEVLPYRDKVWIATRRGLLEFDPKTATYNHYTQANGLSSRILYTIIPSGDNLWLGTQYGLCRFNMVTKEVHNYYESDGLSDNEFNRKAALKARDGRLYFGGLNGINVFDPNILDSLSQLKSASLSLTHFSKLDGERDEIIFYENSLLDPNKPIELYYGDKSYTFQFALLSYFEPSKNTYSYYLDGYEKRWNYIGHTPIINYPSLPPGKYILKIKGKDALGNQSLNELAIPIIVYGPWWNIWWVKLLFVLIILTLIVAYIRWRTTVLKNQKIVLEKTVEKRTAELKKQKERAEISEKHKEQFLANMSHEIRTPMHAISGMTKILQRNKTLPSQNAFLKAMRTSSDNLIVILNDVLDLSKIEAGKLDIENMPMNPKSVVENVVQTLQFKAEEKGLILNYQIGSEVPSLVMGDSTRLNQILLNLTGNAIKFTEKGKITISLKKENDQLKFSVKDTGIGIDKDKLDTVFQAFEQAKTTTTRIYGGTGLGLSISKQLTELQGGKIWVESEVKKGSVFYVLLPIVLADSNAISQDILTEEQLKVMANSLKGLRILLAEDNDFNQMIAQDDLSFYIETVQIDTVENGELALEKFKKNDYDLILMDVQMPEMNGFEATQAIRQFEETSNKNPIPIIAMTASLLKSEIDNCYDAGMDSYIPKPYKMQELIGTIYYTLKK